MPIPWKLQIAHPGASLALVFFASVSVADPGTLGNDPVPVPSAFATEYFDIESQFVDETFRIFIAKPYGMQPGQEYPAIYALDANLAFGAVVDMSRMLAIGNEIPATIVIGIGYAIDTGFTEAASKRYRDLSPTKGGILEATTQKMSDPQGLVQPGGGPAFLNFLRKELKPTIAARYPVDTNDATLGGASLAGLFPAWVLLTAPELFQRYIIISPSIWWNGEEVWQWEEAYAAKHDDIDARVFVTAGGLETQAELKGQIKNWQQLDHPMRDGALHIEKAYDRHGWPRMAEITPEFVAKLESRNYPSLAIHNYNMPDETHLSVPWGGWARGLHYVFGYWQPSRGNASQAHSNN